MSRFLFIFFACFTSIYAHPHFFIDSKLSIKDDLIQHEWIFDRLNSRVLLFDFDKNKNKIFDDEEKQEFIKTHFLGLKDNNYNIFLTLDDEIEVEPKNIDVKFENKRVSLSFNLDVELTKVFTMCTMDEKIYMAFNLVKLDSSENLEVQKSEYDYCVGVVE